MDEAIQNNNNNNIIIIIIVMIGGSIILNLRSLVTTMSFRHNQFLCAFSLL